MLSINRVIRYPGLVTKVIDRQHLVTRGVQALLYGFDMARMLKGLLEELTFGNMGVELPTYVRYDSPDALYRVYAVSTMANEKRPRWIARE